MLSKAKSILSKEWENPEHRMDFIVIGALFVSFVVITVARLVW